ncbi:MAG: DUF2905 domain-containing protein [Bacteroidota bacterium]
MTKRMQAVGRLLTIFGVVMIGIGFLLTYFDKIPFIGKLPGDITIRKENMQIFFPIATSIVLSMAVSLILSLISGVMKK